MGVPVYIKLKEGVNPEKMNEFLAKNKLSQFTTEEDNIWWLNDINTNPKSHQSHLKPADRDLTMEELKSFFSIWTEVNLLSFDVGYSRTSQEEIDAYCQMIFSNADSIEYIDGADDMLERYDISPDVKPILERLNKPEETPEMLPKEEQHHPDLKGGLFLCKSFSLKPFWVIFGNVERPKFLKKKIYKDDCYNNIYHDKQGYGYMMLPLLKLDGKEFEFLAEMYEYAWGMGLREDFFLLIPLVYHMGIANVNTATDSFIDTYDQPNELKEKFEQAFKYIKSVYEFSGTVHTGFHYSAIHKKFRVNISNNTLEAQISVLTCLLRAVVIKHGDKAAAEMMTKVTGEKFLPAEM